MSTVVKKTETVETITEYESDCYRADTSSLSQVTYIKVKGSGGSGIWINNKHDIEDFFALLKAIPEFQEYFK